MATESDYLVRNTKAVFNHFSELISKKCLISAHFGERNVSFLTAIIELDQKKNTICLDCGPSESMDNQLLASDKILFRTEIDGIKVSFSGKNIKKIKTDNDTRWVFCMPIPNSIFWMQRRQYFRIKIPISHTSSYCRLTLKADQDESEQYVNFRLSDISLKGFSFLNIDPKWIPHLQPDTEFTDCTLHLNNGNQALIGFTIKNNIKLRSGALNYEDRIGCLFKDNLPANFETSIQRYMQDIEIYQKNIG